MNCPPILDEVCGHKLPGALMEFVGEELRRAKNTYCACHPTRGNYSDGLRHIPVDQVTTALINYNVPGTKVLMKEPHFIRTLMG